MKINKVIDKLDEIIKEIEDYQEKDNKKIYKRNAMVHIMESIIWLNEVEDKGEENE